VMLVEPEVAELVARATAPKREQRFATARDMAIAIEQLGRDHGWVASHHEVAEWLEAQCGQDWLRRRERVASIAASEAPPPPSASATLQGHASVTTSLPVEPERPRSSKRENRKVVLLGASVLVLTAAVLLALSLRQAPIAVPPPSAALPPAPIPSVAVAIDETPPAPSMASAAAAPVASAVTAKRPVPKRAPAPAAPSRAQGVRPPDQISKRNPYRE
jgi:hypothetical protein